MAHWKTFFDKEYVGAWDLNGRDVVVTIADIKKGKLKNKGTASSKLVCALVGKDKKFAMNTTNCQTVAAMYGNDVAAWIGKSITIFPTRTTFGGEEVDCVRVRPRIPQKNATAGELRQGEPAHDPATGEVLDTSGVQETNEDPHAAE